MGVVVSEMTMETRMAVERVMANSRKRRPTIPPMSSKGIHARFEVAGDVFHDDDGVVNDEAGGDRESHEREVIQTVAAEIHDGEGADERDGDGDGGDEGGAAISQENEDDDDDEDNGESEGALDVADRRADGGGAVEDDGGVDSLGNGRFDGGHFGTDAIDRVDDVSTGLAVDDEQDRALSVEIAGGANVLDGIDDIGDVREMDGGAFMVAHDDGLEVFGVRDLIVGDDIGGGDAVRDLALGEIGILQAQHGLDVCHGEAVAGELGGIHFHADGGQGAAADVHLADALDLGEFLLDDGGGLVIKPGRPVFVRSEAEDHDRGIGGIDFAVGGIRGEIGGEIGAGGIDGGFDVTRRAVDVAREIELNSDGSCSEATAGGHLGDACDVAELAFERSGDGRGHDFGAGAGETGVDGDSGEVHLRQRRDGEDVEGDGAGDGDRDGEKGGGHRAMDEWGGDVHERPAGCGSVPVFGGLDLRVKRWARLSKKM